ncbi:MAG TPA: DNA-formamidopyrimidine glycosylase family protein [Pseudolysinimonas sp.]|nr:DNA-formamidopyrimidine glycosylase family protein [Pseudolysinimonas sp.]
MPEGHSVHRIARQFREHFLHTPVTVTSPQGRFASGAAQLDGHEIVLARAVGKQLFLEFNHGLWLRVHLGLYGAWDFAGEVGLMRGGEGEASLSSIGAPRLTRLRMAESESLRPDDTDGAGTFPPDPIGAVRVRLLTERAVADLRGPTACEVQLPEQAAASIAKLGPDPLVDDPAVGEQRFVDAVRRKPTAIALLLMDQSVISGIGNVYRAELLFRARLNPFTPGRELPEDVVRELWRDWAHLLAIGVETGQMMTMDDLDAEDYARAVASRDDRHWVYHRTGEPCRVCGAAIAMQDIGGRRLYWCPVDQA